MRGHLNITNMQYKHKLIDVDWENIPSLKWTTRGKTVENLPRDCRRLEHQGEGDKAVGHERTNRPIDTKSLARQRVGSKGVFPSTIVYMSSDV